LKDLYSVDALINNRGHEVERVTYDAYGMPLMKSIHVADVDYSGTVNATDTAAVVANYGLSVGTVGPIYDIDGNGSINAIDSGLVSSSYGSAIGTARVSSVGNPYLFTGRRPGVELLVRHTPALQNRNKSARLRNKDIGHDEDTSLTILIDEY
jgi:hypothetical protein